VIWEPQVPHSGAEKPEGREERLVRRERREGGGGGGGRRKCCVIICKRERERDRE